MELHVIDTNKFKTNLIAIFLSTPLKRENVTKDALLSAILRRGSMKYKTQEEINKKLDEMYGAEFDCGLDNIGKNHVLKFYIETVNDEFLPQNEDILKQSISLVSEIVFNPFVENNKFCEEYVKQEKENLRQIIEAKKDNKAAYAKFRCTEEMYRGMPEGLYRYGYVEDIKNIDASNLYEYYKKLINSCKIDVFVSGKIEKESLNEIIKNDENIKRISERKPEFCINKPQKKNAIQDEKNVQESMEVTQGKLVIGCDVTLEQSILDNKKTRYIGIVYNAILGGTATSKMFQNVREKASLAYTANSTYSYYANSIFISAGIEIENYQKALDIIKRQVDDMKQGDFSDEDIENAKNVIISNIATINDEQDTEIIYNLGQVLSENYVSLEEYAKFIEDVKYNEIKEFAQSVNINTIYFLKN